MTGVCFSSLGGRKHSPLPKKPIKHTQCLPSCPPFMMCTFFLKALWKLSPSLCLHEAPSLGGGRESMDPWLFARTLRLESCGGSGVQLQECLARGCPSSTQSSGLGHLEAALSIPFLSKSFCLSHSSGRCVIFSHLQFVACFKLFP